MESGLGVVRVRATAACLGLIALVAWLAVPPAETSAKGPGHDRRPNILVVMTDDMAATDVALMPNVAPARQSRDHLRRRGRLLPALLPGARHLHHRPVRPQPRRRRQLPSLRLVRDGGPRATRFPAWLQRAGYRTALIGKWLNGYGALDAHGEVPAGLRHLARAARRLRLRLLQLRDERRRRPADLGRRRLRPQAGRVREHRGAPRGPVPGRCRPSSRSSPRSSGPLPTATGEQRSRRTTRPTSPAGSPTSLVREQRGSRKPFFIWWAPAAPHREDVATTLMGRPGPRPAAAASLCAEEQALRAAAAAELQRGRPDRQALEPDLEGAAAHPGPDRPAAARLRGPGGLAAGRRRPRRRAGQDAAPHRPAEQHADHVRLRQRLDAGRAPDPGRQVPALRRVAAGPADPPRTGGRRRPTVRGQVSNVDFAPTLLDAAGAKARADDGRDLAAADHARPKRRPDRALQIEAPAPLFAGNIPDNGWDRPYSGVRTERYTYVVWTETGEQELYDRRVDPYQLTNVAARSRLCGGQEPTGGEADEARAAARGRSCNVQP